MKILNENPGWQVAAVDYIICGQMVNIIMADYIYNRLMANAHRTQLANFVRRVEIQYINLYFAT